MYYQMLELGEMESQQQDNQLQQDDEDEQQKNSKIIKIEVRTLQLSDNVCN